MLLLAVFFPISDLSMFFIIAKEKSNQKTQGLEVKGGATRQGRPFDILVSSGNVPFSLILDQWYHQTTIIMFFRARRNTVTPGRGARGGGRHVRHTLMAWGLHCRCVPSFPQFWSRWVSGGIRQIRWAHCINYYWVGYLEKNIWHWPDCSIKIHLLLNRPSQREDSKVLKQPTRQVRQMDWTDRR